MVLGDDLSKSLWKKVGTNAFDMIGRYLFRLKDFETLVKTWNRRFVNCIKLDRLE